MLAAAPSLWAALTKVDIFPPLTTAPPAPGTYTLGAGSAFTITSDGPNVTASTYTPNMTFGYPGVITGTGDRTDAADYKTNYVDVTGDVMTFAYESITGDFDRCVKITSITADVSNPADAWTRGALMVRTSTNHYSASFQLLAANPQGNNAVRFSGRAIDGQAYWDISRAYPGVTNVLPNQWLRLRRVGDWFAAYVGTDGTNWSLIGQRYQEWPAQVLVGPYAASGIIGTVATVQFANYGATPVNDNVKPVLVSAGTLDKKLVGMKFSEPVDSSTSTVTGNYVVNQGGGTVTINNVIKGIGGDSVYLNVTGLTNDNFTVTVIGGVKDTAGNTINPNSSVAARALGWNAIDLGKIQNPSPRTPTPGDDPYRVGRSVMISSDENPEVEVVGGGSNQWNPGDYVHYIYRNAPLSGNFDVTIAVSRFDRSVRQGGYSNSGLMLRASPYLAGQEYTVPGTKVPMVANATYIEASAPGRGAIPLWRATDGGGYGNGNAGFSWQTIIGGVKGYFSDQRAINAAGDIDPQSAGDTARYLRIKRVGTQYTFYASWNRTDWALVDGPINLPTLPDQLLLGFSTMTDSGSSEPPFSAYGNNGHQIDLNDPLNPLNPTIVPDAPGGRSYMNDSTYAVERIKIFPNGVSDPLPATLALVDVRPADGTSVALSGSWVSKGTFSFDMTGGGTGGPGQNLNSPFDGTTGGGDELTFAYETITGDFDKQVRITSLTNTLYFNDGTAYDYSAPVVDTWARAGLMVRTDTNAYNACLAIQAGNPAGANAVRVNGHMLDGQKYRDFSSDYPGVADVIPNQYLRMKRVGNHFSFYVSKDGVVWSMICQQYMELPNSVLFGPYCAASLNPTAGTNPDGLLSRAQVSFTAYNDVDLADTTRPVLMSVGTIDKKTVGVKFSEQVSSATATALANYSLSQGTVTGARMGIGGDAVYLTVSGLTANTFTVTVTNVTDTFGNKLLGSQTANGKASAWTASDIGYIQNPGSRPTPGDDPYRIGTAVATSSEDEDTSELEVIGGGSNAWDGDYVNYVYDTTPLTGDFEVTCKITRYDKPYSAGGNSDHAGLMLRQALYNATEEYTVEGTKVPYLSMMTYHPRSSGPLPLWRDAVHAFPGAGGQIPWSTVIGGLKGYIPDERATNSAGVIDAQSSPYQAFWLRIKRTGSSYDCSASWDGKNWQLTPNSPMERGVGAGPLLLGYYHENDSGDRIAPFSGYLGNGHTIVPGDPLGLTDSGHSYQNESNFTVSKVRIYKKSSAIGAIKASKVGGNMVINYSGTLVSSTSLNGPWTVVPQQGSPYVTTPAGARMFYRVIP